MKRLRKEAYKKWIDESFLPERTLALTLNFRQRNKSGEKLRQEIAEETLRRFKHALRRKVFGSRKASRLTDEYNLNFVATYEGKASREDGTALHCHALLEVPSGQSVEAWQKLCTEQWTKLEWADPRSFRFDVCWSYGFSTYVLKNRTKDDWEKSIDWDVFHLPPSSTATVPYRDR